MTDFAADEGYINKPQTDMHQMMKNSKKPLKGRRTVHKDSKLSQREFINKIRDYGDLFFDESLAPSGMKYGWKVVMITPDMRSDDYISALRRGWKFVPQDRHPEYVSIIPSDMKEEFEGKIYNNGQVLMEIESELFYEAMDYYNKLSHNSLVNVTESSGLGRSPFSNIIGMGSVQKNRPGR